MTQRRPITSVSEVVREGELPAFRFNFNLLELLFKPRRKLRPEREPPVPVMNPQRCRLVVQIIRGDNLPIRKSRCVNRPGGALHGFERCLLGVSLP